MPRGAAKHVLTLAPGGTLSVTQKAHVQSAYLRSHGQQARDAQCYAQGHELLKAAAAARAASQSAALVERGAAFERKVHEDAVARQHREAARRKKHVLRAAEEARAAEHATASVAPCTVAERSVLWRRIDAVVARYRAANRRALALLLCGLAAIVASALLPSLLLAGFRAQLLDELVLGGPAGAAAAIPQFGGRATSLANRSAAPATFGAWLHEG